MATPICDPWTNPVETVVGEIAWGRPDRGTGVGLGLPNSLLAGEWLVDESSPS